MQITLEIIEKSSMSLIITFVESVSHNRCYCDANEKEVHHGWNYRAHGTQRPVGRHGNRHRRIDRGIDLKIHATGHRAPPGRSLAGPPLAGRIRFRACCLQMTPHLRDR
ncbi:MAG: hypothetical protein JSR95_16795 [Proteobacteria bacterium]|nr:hypothetical protein [Pseudomonadota bacterium]